MKDKKSQPLKISNARKQFEVSLKKSVQNVHTFCPSPHGVVLLHQT